MAKRPLVLFFILIILILTSCQFIFYDKFFPGIFVGDSHLFFLTKTQSQRLIEAKFHQRLRQRILTIDLSTASAKINSSQAIDEAFLIGHTGTWAEKIFDQIKLTVSPRTIKPKIDIDLNEQVNALAHTIYQPPQDATLTIEQSTPSALIKITAGRTGLALDKDQLLIYLEDYLLFGNSPATLPTRQIEPDITNKEAELAKKYLEDAIKEPIKLTFDGNSWLIDAKILIPLLNFTQNNQLIDKNKLSKYLTTAVASKIDQPVIEALFNFDPLIARVTAFKPAQAGKRVDMEKTTQLIILALDNQRPKTITLPVTITQPKIQTQQVNDLGIKELIGRGISHFTGSIPNRLYNIGLAASRINGILVPPGETFSFNDKVGDISAQSGYKQAYVIKSGRTVLDDGGGVCQDSTTLFRAVLNAGLPVVQRVAHAYRVGYYEQGFPAGLDATVFSPSVDFKFKNDTPSHILIQAYTVGNSLYVDLYGTSDNRVATLTKPIITNQTPPPPELRQDDPELPKGEVKQIDFAAWGADVSFTRTVTKGGEVMIKETWKSNYKPWQAVYLVGTQ